MFIADKNQNGTILGNDLSEHRLNIAKSLKQKYHPKRENIKFLNKDACELKSEDFGISLDKALVDVECSHDGSFKHVLKYIFPKKR